MTPPLQTARLSFRDFTVDDYDSVHAYGSDPEVTRYTAFGPNTPEQTKAILQLVSSESAQAERANYNFALIHKQTNKLIGSCGLMRSDMNGPQYSLGIGEGVAEAWLQVRRLHAEVVLHSQRVARSADVRDAPERVGAAGGVSNGAHSP